MATSRTYDDPCGVARALDSIGERWALLVVRELLYGPKRFRDLLRGLAGISQNVLAERLRELERAAVVRRELLGPPASVAVYQLTDRGAALRPVIVELGRWGGRLPLASGRNLTPDALVLALETTYDATRAPGLRASVGLHIDGDRFLLEAAGGALRATRADPAAADAVLTADAATMRDLAFLGSSPEALRGAGRLLVEGDAAVAERLLSCFPRPTPPPPSTRIGPRAGYNPGQAPPGRS
ncbi:MAG: winged helix-turn-helix transcriptional regulator [Candidatus Dormiibacterota bacterium]